MNIATLLIEFIKEIIIISKYSLILEVALFLICLRVILQ